ncbi:hypothetical protein MMC07_001046 [Pseudocyphellaria aurata]|nr:hypothetical protein [Pseudocyphellaria aurata]
MNRYMIFLFTIILMIQANPMPETFLDALLSESRLDEGAEDWIALQPSFVDSVEQYPPGSSPIAALGLDFEQRPSTPAGSAQPDQSNSIQVAVEDSIRPISGISLSNPNYVTSSSIDSILGGSNLLANGPTKQKDRNEHNAPIVPPAPYRIIHGVCPSWVLPSRGCCKGAAWGSSELPPNIPPNSPFRITDLLRKLIITTIFVEGCEPYENHCDPKFDWCCQLILPPNEVGSRTGHMCVEAKKVVGDYD